LVDWSYHTDCGPHLRHEKVPRGEWLAVLQVTGCIRGKGLLCLLLMMSREEEEEVGHRLEEEEEEEADVAGVSPHHSMDH